MKILENTPKKTVGRKPKHSDKINNEDLQNLNDGITTPKEVAEKHAIPVNAVHNKVHRQKLKLSFQNKEADPKISSQAPPVLETETQSPQDANIATGGIPLDATEALRGIWAFTDSMLAMVSYLSKGQIEYTKLDSTELDTLASACNQSPFMRKLATQEGLSVIIIVGTIISVFGRHIKFNLKKKHNKDNADCKCDDCRKIKLLEKELIEVEKSKAKQKEMINNVPSTAFNEPPEALNENKPTDELLREKALNSDAYNESKEYKLPD